MIEDLIHKENCRLRTVVGLGTLQLLRPISSMSGRGSPRCSELALGRLAFGGEQPATTASGTAACSRSPSRLAISAHRRRHLLHLSLNALSLRCISATNSRMSAPSLRLPCSAPRFSHRDAYVLEAKMASGTVLVLQLGLAAPTAPSRRQHAWTPRSSRRRMWTKVLGACASRRLHPQAPCRIAPRQSVVFTNSILANPSGRHARGDYYTSSGSNMLEATRF